MLDRVRQQLELTTTREIASPTVMRRWMHKKDITQRHEAHSMHTSPEDDRHMSCEHVYLISCMYRSTASIHAPEWMCSEADVHHSTTRTGSS